MTTPLTGPVLLLAKTEIIHVNCCVQTINTHPYLRTGGVRRSDEHRRDLLPTICLSRIVFDNGCAQIVTGGIAPTDIECKIEGVRRCRDVNPTGKVVRCPRCQAADRLIDGIRIIRRREMLARVTAAVHLVTAAFKVGITCPTIRFAIVVHVQFKTWVQ